MANEILMHFRSLKKTANDVSMEEPTGSDKDGNSLSLMDILTDSEDVAERIELLVRAEQMYIDLDKCLDDREKEIIVMRYGLFGKPALTQREAAKKLGISRSYVSRIEKRALEKLRHGLFPCFLRSRVATRFLNSVNFSLVYGNNPGIITYCIKKDRKI